MTRRLPGLTIPSEPGELSPEWMTAALRSRGFLREARVSGLRYEILGEGEGFVGTIARFFLELDAQEPGAPATLIGKFPTGLAQNKALAEMGGAYEREIRFYEELAPRVPIRTPRCYYSDRDSNPLTGREPGVVAFLERWPDWLVRWLLPLLEWLSTRSRRRYVLLIEDLAPARVGDQVTGCSAEVAEHVVRNLARLHAAFWGGLQGPEYGWLAQVQWLKRWFHVLYRRSRPVFEAGMGSRFPAIGGLAEFLDMRGLDVVDRLAAHPHTLSHGDYRLDNLCLRESGEGLEVTTFDWQGPSRAPGVLDLAYFVSGNLREDVAPHESRLVAAYHEELVRGGVSDYPLERCRHGYELAKLLVAYRIILGIEMLDFQSERGTALIDGWLARLSASLPADCQALLDG